MSDWEVRPVQRVLTREQARPLIGDDVGEMEPNLTLPGIYVDADTQEPAYVYLPMPTMVAELRAATRGISMGTTRRAIGVKNASASFGMMPRRPAMRRESCKSTSMSTQQPDEHRVLVELGAVFTGMMRSLLPQQANADHSYIEKVLPEWRLTDDALWTSGVVNRSSTLPYHLDTANHPTWSAMPVVRRGMRGGYLHVPEYDLVCACRDGWVSFFVGEKLVHGVTPMRALTEDAYRYSVVYYALQGMQDCFTAAVEQRRGRVNRTQREVGMGTGERVKDKTPKGKSASRPHAYVLSAGRDQQVPAMMEQLDGLDATWVIPVEQRPEYQAAGAETFVLQPADKPGISRARNIALQDACMRRAPVCVQLSDDLSSVKRLTPEGRSAAYTASEAIRDMMAALRSTGHGLAGCSPTANAFYAKERVHERAFVVGDFIAIDTRDPLWFDETLPLKEDYDYTLQHIERFGGVARCDWLLPTFRHRTNPGGAVAYRTAELEQEAITILKQKWPDNVRDNPKRPNEILLRFPKIAA